MASERKPVVRQHRVELAIKVDLRYPDRDTFARRFALNLSRTGIFVRAPDPAPVGTWVRFEYRLVDGTRVLRGIGIVRWSRDVGHAEEPNLPPGMGIEFVDLDADSEELVQRIVARFGEGQRAPRRAPSGRAQTPGPAPPAVAGPGGRPAVALDADEESALDMLLGGDLGPTVPSARQTPGSAGARDEEGASTRSAEQSGQPDRDEDAAAAVREPGQPGQVLGIAGAAGATPLAAVLESGKLGSPPLAAATAGEPALTPAAATTAGEPAPTPAADATAGEPAPTPAADATAGEPAPTPAADATAGEPAPTPAAATTAGEPAPTPAADATAGEPAPTPAATATAGEPAPTPAADDETAPPPPAAATANEPAPADAAPAGSAGGALPVEASRHEGSPDPVLAGETPPPSPPTMGSSGPATTPARHDASSVAPRAAAPGYASAPQPPVAVGPDGHPLAEPVGTVQSTGAAARLLPAATEAELIADLASTRWRGAVVSKGAAFAEVGDAVDVTVGAGDTALSLPSPLAWLVAPWPAPRARVLARRLHLDVVEDESGFPAVRWRSLTLSSAAIVQMGLEQLLSACAATARPRQGRIVIPAATSDAARRLILRRLAGLGVARCTTTAAPTAVLARAGLAGAGRRALVIEVLSFESRVTLVGDSGVVGAGVATLDACDAQADAVVALELGRRLASPAPELGAPWRLALLHAAARAREHAPDGPWLFRSGADTLALGPASVEEGLDRVSESLALACDALARHQGLDPAELDIVVAPERPLWPRLSDTLARVLGGRLCVLDADPWTRLRGLAGG